MTTEESLFAFGDVPARMIALSDTIMAEKTELSLFLKAARSRVLPGEWGLRTERRRTKGLRREEVAALAGMSVTWYTLFEQGRDVRLSDGLLDRLARTLKLESGERDFLFALAQDRPPAVRYADVSASA